MEFLLSSPTKMDHCFSSSLRSSFLMICILISGGSAGSIGLAATPENLCIEGTRGSFFDLRCTFLRDYHALQNALSNLTEHDFILELSHLDWEEFPLGSFQNVSLHTLIVANSTFNAFQNSGSDVKSLFHFSLENITTHEMLQWDRFAALTKLQVLSIYNTTISSNIDSSFADHLSKSIEFITIAESSITDVKADSFRQMKNLNYLRISHNKLETFPKLQLKAAEKLEQLRLDYNKINSLPDAVFDNLTHLKVLSLSNNSLSTLPEQVFSVLWRPSVRIELRDNPIKCDCRIQWMVSTLSKPRNLVGKCAHPKRLYGRNLEDLRNEDLNCGDI